MPAILDELLNTALTARQESAQPFTAASNSTIQDLKVICAWPVSGQYGPGSRVLYYALVAACVFARKVDWLRNASLAGALLLPVVAALHGIVLAAVHNDHAVDLDVYGALQLCAIGALAAPVTVRISQTYFNDPGRNTIFVWSCIVLAGLLSLTVEFFRLGPLSCNSVVDDFGNMISTDPDLFPYGKTQCGLPCNESYPVSPIRGGSANNIYVIPAPSRLTFNAAMLLAAACCIPAILLCVWMWIKIMQENSAKPVSQKVDEPGPPSDETEADQPSEHSSSPSSQDSAEEGTRSTNREKLATGTEILVVLFGALVVAILFVGEWNLFSRQIEYQTEPIANIGQWQPIVGTGLVIFGSLYLLLVQAMQQERNSRKPDNCPQVKLTDIELPGMDVYMEEQEKGSKVVTVINRMALKRPLELDFTYLGIKSAAVENIMTGRTVPIVKYYRASMGPYCAISLRLTNIMSLDTQYDTPIHSEVIKDRAEHRETPIVSDEETRTSRRTLLSRFPGLFRGRIEIMRPLASVMITVSDKMFTSKDGLGNEDLAQGKSANYPQTPGEHLVNPHLSETRSIYGDRRDSVDSHISRLSSQPSRPRSTTAGSNTSDKCSPSPDHQGVISRRKDTISTLKSDPGTIGRRDMLDVPTPASPIKTPTRSDQSIEDDIQSSSVPHITITMSGEPLKSDLEPK